MNVSPVEVAPLEELVKRAHDLRLRIRKLGSFRKVPEDVLRSIGRLARDCGDTIVAEAVLKHLGTLDPPPTNPSRRPIR